MARRQPIPKRRKRKAADPVLWGTGIAFWFVLVVALAVGGPGAVSGLPMLVQMLSPRSALAAEARGNREGERVAFVLPEPLAAAGNSHAPQVLQPVVTHDWPEWIARNADSAAVPSRTAVHPRGASIAIVIDDLGADADSTRRAIALPKAVTLSFLPYPALAPPLAAEAARAGHEVIAHVPMEPDGPHDAGPMVLREGLSDAEIRTRLLWALDRLPGASGVNNHEGSRFTADRMALIPVAETLADRHLFFLDSRTTPDTQVVTVARAFGVASAGRDVFLDEIETPEAVAAELAAAENRARANGIAIAIGHPHAATLAVLSAWTADAARRGFHLVPASTAIRMKTENEIGNPLRIAARSAKQSR